MPYATRPFGLAVLTALSLSVGACAPLGSLMSPYSEKFSCKNDDHGQCIDPERAYEDARAGIRSKSVAAVTNDGKMLRDKGAKERVFGTGSAYGDYRASLYRELQGLIEAPVTPMLRPARTIRTLILPYADPQRPDRLYMPRYVYSILDRPEWVVGTGLVASPQRSDASPILGQSQDPAPVDSSGAPATNPELVP